MESVKIIVRKTDYVGMDNVIGKVLSAKKDDTGAANLYIVTTDELVANGADPKEFEDSNDWEFLSGTPFIGIYDVVEEVTEG